MSDPPTLFGWVQGRPAVARLIDWLLYPRAAGTAVVPHLAQGVDHDGQRGHDGAPRYDRPGGPGTVGAQSAQSPATGTTHRR